MSSNSQWVNDIVVNWALTATAIVLTIGRYVIRYFYSQKLYWDDLAHFCALATLIAHGATNQITLNYKAELATAAASKTTSDSQLLSMYEHVSYLNDVNNSLLYLVFWEVKVAFLLFYRHLFHTNRRFNIVWWIVLVVTVCLVWGPIGGVIATCSGQTTLAGYKYCNGATAARNTKLIYTCVINVVTDLAIMALPFWMLRELKVKRSQKLGLAFIFSLATFTVVLDIVRTVEAVAGNQDLYTILELNFNVIVSCLPSYRALLRLENRKSSRKYYKNPDSSGATDTSQHSRKGSLPILNSFRKASLPFVNNKASSTNDSTQNSEPGIEMQPGRIRVQTEYVVERDPSRGPRDPYEIEPDSNPESRTSLVDPHISMTVPALPPAGQNEQRNSSLLSPQGRQSRAGDSSENLQARRQEPPVREFA